MHEVCQASQESLDTSSAPLSRNELRYRLRQQSLLGEFGRTAMQTRNFREILQRATELCAIGLEAPFVKVLEYEPDEERLMVRAGVGWAPDTIDAVSLAADIGSPAGYAYQTGVPSFRTTWRRTTASARHACWRITASGALSTC